MKIKNMEETTTQQRSVPFPYSSLYLLGWKLCDESSPSPGIRAAAFPASSWQVLRDQLLSWAFAVYFMGFCNSHVVEFKTMALYDGCQFFMSWIPASEIILKTKKFRVFCKVPTECLDPKPSFCSLLSQFHGPTH